MRFHEKRVRPYRRKRRKRREFDRLQRLETRALSKPPTADAKYIEAYRLHIDGYMDTRP